MKLAETLKSLRKSKHLTVDELCGELGMKRGTYIHYEVGDREPNLEMLIKVADFYSVSLDTMFERDGDSDETQLIDCYRQATADDKYVVWAVLNKYRREKKVIKQLKRDMKLFRLPASAGTGAFLDSEDYDMVRVGPDVPISSSFGVRISGDSMEPKYKDGGIAWVQMTPDVREGEVGVFVLNNEGYIKKYERGRLISLNPAYKPVILREDDNFRTVGKVLAVTDSF